MKDRWDSAQFFLVCRICRVTKGTLRVEHFCGATSTRHSPHRWTRCPQKSSSQQGNVLQHIKSRFTFPEFNASWNVNFKRPIHWSQRIWNTSSP